MGNSLEIKLKNKIKFDLKQKPMNTISNANISVSNTSIYSDHSICYDFKESTDDDSESETEFIEKELKRLQSDDSDEDEQEKEQIEADENTKSDFNNMNSSMLSQIVNLGETQDKLADGYNKEERTIKNKKRNEKKENKVEIDPIKAIPFKNQDINEIRKRGEKFKDDVFVANVTAVTNNPQSDFGKQLIQSSRCRSYDLRELDRKLVWARPEVLLDLLMNLFKLFLKDIIY